MINSFRTTTLISFRTFCTKYGLNFDYQKDGEPADILNDFVNQFRDNNADGQIYLIIDEYDHFANELLSLQTELFSDVISKTGFVRKWYEKIKDNTANGIIARFFATGVSPITLDSLTSGFNIATDLTIDSLYMGMTNLRVPNYVVKELYFSYFEKILEEDMNMNEKYIKTICFTLCMLSKCYLVESENEADKGYTNIQLMKRPGIDVNYYAIIEFKYLSKEKGTKENVGRKLEEARQQLKKYNDSPKFKEMNNLKKWAVVFVQDKCVNNEEC